MQYEIGKNVEGDARAYLNFQSFSFKVQIFSTNSEKETKAFFWFCVFFPFHSKFVSFVLISWTKSLTILWTQNTETILIA